MCSQDMRRVTAWVVIVAVPRAVTGYLGQNVPCPGFGTGAGVIASTLIVLVFASVLFIIFNRNKWAVIQPTAAEIIRPRSRCARKE
jgi:magnesium transporter